MSMTIIDNYKESFDKAIEHLKTEITSLRTGRATPALVEDMSVEAYGVKQQLKAIASISVADAKTLNIQPWDKGVLHDIEVAIRNSDLGLNPVNDGTMIRLILPDLTSERRQELIKVLNKKLEETRIVVRKVREEIRDAVHKAEEVKEISEDDRFFLFEKIDELVKEYNEQIKHIGAEKEEDILKV